MGNTLGGSLGDGTWADHLGGPLRAPIEDVLGVHVPLPSRLVRSWSQNPARTVLRASSGVAVGAGELEAWTRSVAVRLRQAGAAPGDRIGWVPTTDIPSVVVFLGAMRAGIVPVAVGTRSTQAEIAHVLSDCRPVYVVSTSGAPAETARAAAGATAGRVPVLLAEDLAGGWSPAGIRGTGDRGTGDRGTAALDAVSAEDPAVVVYTSGTTGRPKGAVLSHRALAAGTASLVLAWQIDETDRLLLCLPLFHVHGLVAGLLATLAAGGSVLLHDRFDAGAVLDVARRREATLFYGVPTMYHRLEAHGGSVALGRLRLCVSGSAPLAPDLWSRLAAGGSGPMLLERYGMTETLLTVSNPYDGARRPGTVGTPLPGVALRLADPVADDGSGVLLVSGPTLFEGYFDRPAATAEVMEDGWFTTGDIVARDEAGYIVVRGRATEMIICGGHNVYPAEVEDALAAHPGVAEVAVAGVPSDEWGEEVGAWVVAEGVSEAQLAALAAASLAPHKRPRYYRFVGELPRNAMGKVQRRALG